MIPSVLYILFITIPLHYIYALHHKHQSLETPLLSNNNSSIYMPSIQRQYRYNQLVEIKDMNKCTISVIICCLVRIGTPSAKCLFYVTFKVEGHGKSQNNKPSIPLEEHHNYNKQEWLNTSFFVEFLLNKADFNDWMVQCYASEIKHSHAKYVSFASTC